MDDAKPRKLLNWPKKKGIPKGLARDERIALERPPKTRVSLGRRLSPAGTGKETVQRQADSPSIGMYYRKVSTLSILYNQET